jgi:hypothetical protein
MAYAEVTDVQSEFKGITFSTTTAVTTAKIEDFICQADAYINSRIGFIYITPVTSGEALEVLKEISIKLVAHRVKKILEVKTGGTVVDQGAVANDRAEAMAMLKEIVEKKMILIGADLASSSGGINSYASDNSEEYVFEKGVDQW